MMSRHVTGPRAREKGDHRRDFAGVAWSTEWDAGASLMMGEEVRASSDGIGILPSRKPWVSTMADASASPRVIAVGFGVAQNLTTFPISSPPTNELRVQRPTVLTGGRDPCPPPVLLLGSVHAARGAAASRAGAVSGAARAAVLEEESDHVLRKIRSNLRGSLLTSTGPVIATVAALAAGCTSEGCGDAAWALTCRTAG